MGAAADIGLTAKEIHQARLIRDAEQRKPGNPAGIRQQTIDLEQRRTASSAALCCHDRATIRPLGACRLARHLGQRATSFTLWLARPENLTVLGEALNIELELEAQERAVGPFRADILCKDIGTDRWVLIENQLERTDHTHLGQLLTYASGLDAVTIVWIAARFTEEHRSTLDWLNKITNESFRFFGLEVELWKIGNSPAAPRSSMGFLK